MSTKTITFLKKPQEIKRALAEITKKSKHLDMAVAFVGREWQHQLSNFSGHIRLICWLSSTNTNPRSIQELVDRPNTDLRQRDSMHCKVYLSPGRAAIIGSANLSASALSDLDDSGQDEAAVLVTDRTTLKEIRNWFNALWLAPLTEHISDLDLEKAKRAWAKAREEPRSHGRRSGVPNQGRNFSPSAEILDSLEQWSLRARGISDLTEDIGEPSRFVRRLAPDAITKQQLIELVDHLASWTGHPGAYKTFKMQPLRQIRSGLQLLFRETVPLSDRLSTILDDNLLEGLRLPSLSLLLYWRTPESYPPFNHRTSVLLKDHKLLRAGVSSSSPKCYIAWISYAGELAELQSLPTPGHVDRMVHDYYQAKFGR